MHIKINYKNNLINKKTTNNVIFVDDKFNLRSLKQYIYRTEYTFINNILKYIQ